MRRAVFLDRDGVINVEKNYVYKIEDFVFMDGIFELLSYFQINDYLIFVITNQAGIGRGYYTEEDFHVLNDWMTKEFQRRNITVEKTYYCPYHPKYGIGRYRVDSFFRKPNPGMINQAIEEYGINIEESLLIGDKLTDIEAGIRAGIKRNYYIGETMNSDVQCAHDLHGLLITLKAQGGIQ